MVSLRALLRSTAFLLHRRVRQGAPSFMSLRPLRPPHDGPRRRRGSSEPRGTDRGTASAAETGHRRPFAGGPRCHPPGSSRTTAIPAAQADASRGLRRRLGQRPGELGREGHPRAALGPGCSYLLRGRRRRRVEVQSQVIQAGFPRPRRGAAAQRVRRSVILETNSTGRRLRASAQAAEGPEAGQHLRPSPPRRG